MSLLGLFLSVVYLSDWQRVWRSWLFGIGIIVCIFMGIGAIFTGNSFILDGS